MSSSLLLSGGIRFLADRVDDDGAFDSRGTWSVRVGDPYTGYAMAAELRSWDEVEAFVLRHYELVQ